MQFCTTLPVSKRSGRMPEKFPGSTTGWLFGEYSLADVFYTPVAARIIGYGLPVSESTRSYCKALLNDPAVLQWRTEALKVTYDPDPYTLGLPTTQWPTFE